MTPIEQPWPAPGPSVPPIPGPIDLPWFPTKRRPTKTPRHQRTPWTDPRIANIIQRAAPAFVAGQVITASGNVGTLTATLPSSVTSGNCIVIAVAAQGSTFATVPTSGLGGKITQATAAANTGNCIIYLYFINNSVAGSETISLVTGGTTVSMAVLEYSGIGSIAGDRSIVDASNAGGLNNVSSHNLGNNPVQSGSILIQAITDATTGLTWTQSNALTNRRVSITSTWDLAVADGVLSSTSIASVTGAWSNGGTLCQGVDAGIILRPSGTQTVAGLRIAANGAATTITTLSYTGKLGDLLIAQIMTGTTGQTTTSVSNALGYTWTKIDAIANASGGELSLWYAWATSTSSDTFTANFSGTTTSQTFLASYPGIVPSANPVDIVAKNTGNGTAVSVGPSSVTSIPGETAILFIGTPGAGGTSTPQSGTSLIGHSSSANASLYAETLVLNATAAQTMTATLGATQQWSAILITIKTGGVSMVQSSFQSGSVGGNSTLPMSFNMAPGNSLVVSSANSPTFPITSVTSPQSDTFTRRADGSNASGPEVCIWEAHNIHGGASAGAVRITVVSASGAPNACMVHELSGIDASAPFDVASTNTGNSQTAATGSTVTPTYLFELAIAVASDAGSGKAYTASSPFAMPAAPITTFRDMATSLATVFSPGAAPSAQSTSFAIPGGANVQWAAAIATFKITGSGTYYNRALAENATAAEAFTRTVAMPRALAEAAAAVEAVGRTVRMPRALAENATAAEAFTRTVHAPRGIAEAAAAVEAVGRTVRMPRALAENATAAEAFTRTVHAPRGIAEMATATETVGFNIITFRRFRLDISKRLKTLLTVSDPVATTTLVITDPLPITTLTITLGTPEAPMSIEKPPMAGTPIILTFDFTDTLSGSSEAPASFVAYAQKKDGTPIATYHYPADGQVTKPDAVNFPGRFEVVFDSTGYDGWWVVEGRCPSGIGQAVEEKEFFVRPRTAS